MYEKRVKMIKKFELVSDNSLSHVSCCASITFCIAICMLNLMQNTFGVKRCS